VESHLTDAEALVDERPLRAWQRAAQAVRLIGNRELPNGVSDLELRGRARTTLLATAARLLVDGVPSGTTRPDVVGAVRDALREAESASEGVSGALDAFEELAGWTDPDHDRLPFGLLEAAAKLGGAGAWLTSALPSVAQELRNAVQDSTGEHQAATHYIGDVEGWLRATGYVGDAARVARRLRVEAAGTLLDHAPVDTGLTGAVVRAIVPEDARLTARLLEAEGRLTDAAAAFERAGLADQALRVWRRAGDWEQAIRLAEGSVLRELEWLRDVETLTARKPVGLEGRLTPAERQRLTGLLEAAYGVRS
ncbi:MAG: hypothetical protein OXQ28_05100, partial [Acidobacteriota bacterium]|nr:hypothetical protein [Acidobacteriota bacterium]